MSIARRLPGCSLALFGTVAIAQASDVQFTIPLREGTPVPGVGTVTEIIGFEINDHGSWIAVVETDNPNANVDEAVLLDGELLLREGDPIPSLPGKDFDSFGFPSLDRHGRWLLSIEADDGFQHLLFDGEPILQSGGLIELAPFPLATTISKGFEARLDDSGKILFHVDLWDPSSQATLPAAMARDVDTAGNLGPFELLAYRGQVLPGSEFPLTGGGFPMDAGGGVVVTHVGEYQSELQLLAWSGLLVGDEYLAREGLVDPYTGRVWEGLGGTRSLSVNASGNIAWAGRLDGDSTTDGIIMLDGETWMQEGDALAATALRPLTLVGYGTITLADNGDLYWYGQWEDEAQATHRGFFRNDELLVEAGVTEVDGITITDVQQPWPATLSEHDEHSVSDDGRFVLARVHSGPRDMLVMISPLGAITDAPACFVNEGSLASTTVAPSIGNPMNLTLDQAQSASALATLFISTQPLPGHPPCGLQLPGLGELVIDVLPPNPVLAVSEFAGGEPVTFHFGLPDLIALVGLRFWAQGLFDDPLNFVEPMRLTNAVTIDVGHAP